MAVSFAAARLKLKGQMILAKREVFVGQASFAPSVRQPLLIARGACTAQIGVCQIRRASACQGTIVECRPPRQLKLSVLLANGVV